MLHQYQDNPKLITDILELQRSRGQSAGYYADGVRMEEIVEGTVGALHILSREAHNRAKLRINPITALTRGQRDGGCIRRTMVGRPPCNRTAFWATSHSGCLEVRCLKLDKNVTSQLKNSLCMLFPA